MGLTGGLLEGKLTGWMDTARVVVNDSMSRSRPVRRGDCSQLPDPQHKKDMDLLEQAQRRPQR